MSQFAAIAGGVASASSVANPHKWNWLKDTKNRDILKMTAAGFAAVSGSCPGGPPGPKTA